MGFESEGDDEDDWAPRPYDPRVLKWAWNERDGLLIWQADANDQPTHNEKTLHEWHRNNDASDSLGFVAPGAEGQYEVESFSPHVPPKAYAQVKTELAKMLPDAEVLLPQDADKALGVQFGGDPQYLARRRAAAHWAQENLSGTPETPPRTPVIDPQPLVGKVEARPSITDIIFGNRGNFKGLKKAGVEADMEGAMVALFLSEEDAKKLKVK